MAKIALRILNISITILVSVLVIFGLYKVGMYCYEFGYRVYTEPAVTEGIGQDMLVQITSSTTDKDLSKTLEEKGLIRDDKLFYIQLKLSGFKLQPGVYTVNSSMNAFDLMHAMTPEEDEAKED